MSSLKTGPEDWRMNGHKSGQRRCVGCSGTVYLEVLQLAGVVRQTGPLMVLAPLVAGLFKWRQFEPKVILLAVG